jgi:chemotaxis protein MotB
VNKDDMSKLKDKLEQAIKDTSTLQKIKEHVVFTVTNEGLRVELLEDESGTFFESGSPIPTPAGRDLLAKLAEEIGELPNRITMEGHTDSKPFSGKAGYTNWELSSDRANAARRWMQDSGMREGQVAQVRGFADQSLRNPADAADPKNRRITVIILYAHTAETEAEDKAKAEEEKTSKTEAKPAESKGRESRPAAKPGAKPAAKTSAFSFLDPVTKIFGKK